MEEHFDVIVVGVGAMGAATCLALVQRGCKVLGLDQSNIPNSLGSSHGHSRIVRLSYYEHSDYVPLLRRAFDLWKDIETSTGRTLLHLNGALYIGTRNSELIDGSLRAAREHNLPHSELSHSELRRKFAQFTLPDDFVGMMDEIAGWVSPEAAHKLSLDIGMPAAA